MERQGIELVDAEFRREPVGMVLRLYIDKPEGVDLEVCAAVSEQVDGAIGQADLIKDAYNLEVSSPGLERRLTKASHFQRFVGEKARIKLKKAISGRKKFTGTIVEAGEIGFELAAEDGNHKFSYEELASANLKYEP